MDDIDDISYIRFCGPQNLSRSLHTLQGILHGIRLDNTIDSREISELRSWCEDHASYRKINPFNEILTIFEKSLEDGILDADELKDISWFLDRALGDGTFYGGFTVDLQNLQGILHGILADRVVTKDEVVALSTWLEDHEHLAGCYPYDEIYAILLDVLKDGKVDDEEAEFLKAFFSEFVTLSVNNQINITRELKKKVTALGVCAVDPNIEFNGKVFCFTGASIKANRSALADMVEELGGIFKRKPTKDISYLVYGSAGNQCWAYSCYGRKVEQIMTMRKSGGSAIIVHENDFWDAYEYNKYSQPGVSGNERKRSPPALVVKYKMNVWIQLHDFSSEDLKDPSSENALKLYNEFDWDSEILKEENANAEGIECCDPGMGFVSDDHSILHLVPTITGAMVHYHFRKAGRFLGLFPTVRDEAISVTDYPSEGIQDLVLEHYRGNQRSVKELLSEFGNESR